MVAATFAASSLDGKGDWNTTKTGYTLTNLSDANAGKLEDMLDGTGAVLTLSQLRVASASANAGIYVTNSVGHAIQATATAVGKHGIWGAGLGTGTSYGICGHSITGNGIYAYSSGTGHAFSAYADGTGDAFKLASDGGNIAAELKTIADTALSDYGANTTVPDAAGVVATALGVLETHGDSTWATATSVAVSDKTGFSLAATGLDAVATTAPAGVASNFREMLVQTWRHWFKKSTLTATELKTYADNGTDVLTTQTVSDDDTTQTRGAAS